MIVIRTIEELKAERYLQFKALIENGKEESDFFLDLAGADLKGADLSGADLYLADLTGADLTGAKLMDVRIKNTIITQSQYDELYRLYSHEFMAGFIIKELEVAE